jgi:hypothetical protein
MNQLEKKFHEDMRDIYLTAKKELKYNASRFWQLVCEKGGVQAAKILIAKDGGTYGFEILWEHRRLDLSVEAHVLKSEYNDLFTDDERRMCRDRLMQFGFDPEQINN